MLLHKLFEDNVNIRNRIFKFCVKKNLHGLIFLFNSFYYFLKLLYQCFLYLCHSFSFHLFSFIYSFAPKHLTLSSCPTLSVIVPNYNHKKYLKRRLNSIYRQSYKNIEVILLDDCSNDGSIKILQKFRKKHESNTKLVLNDKNSGNVFLQWKKGIELAKGDFVWIAESDDWCSLNFAKKLINSLEKNNSIIACAETLGTKKARIAWGIKQYCISLNIDWSKEFCVGSNTLFDRGFGWRNIIPNVSSVIFRKTEDLSAILNDYTWQKMKLCGDWVFYLFLLKDNGIFNFVPSAYNYHRFHKNNTSVKVDSSISWFHDHKILSDYMHAYYYISPAVIMNFKYNYLLHWKLFNSNFTGCPVTKIFKNVSLYNDYTNLNVLVVDYNDSATCKVGCDIKTDFLMLYGKKTISQTYNLPIINMCDKGFLDVINIFRCKKIYTSSKVLGKEISNLLKSLNLLDKVISSDNGIIYIGTNL